MYFALYGGRPKPKRQKKTRLHYRKEKRNQPGMELWTEKKSINDAEREKNKSISANKNIHAYVIAQNCKIWMSFFCCSALSLFRSTSPYICMLFNDSMAFAFAIAFWICGWVRTAQTISTAMWRPTARAMPFQWQKSVFRWILPWNKSKWFKFIV